MATATFSIRMDNQLRNDFKKTCEDFGLSITSAINVFAKAVVLQKRIPFDIATKEVVNDKAYKSFLDLKNEFQLKNAKNMSLKDINKIIYAKK